SLGNGSNANSFFPVTTNISSVSRAAGGGAHTCARKTDTSVWCWGNNFAGELGDGTMTDSNVPVPVKRTNGSSLLGVTQLTCGDAHTCARLSDSSLACWGLNQQGRLGFDPATCVACPNPIPPTLPVFMAEVAAGVAHTCARGVDQSAWCWGSNVNGQ